MSKIRLLTKKFILSFVLVVAMLASTIMGLSLVTSASAAGAGDMYLGNFTVTGGSVKYDTARIQIGGGVGENDTIMGGFNYEEVDTLIVEFTEGGSFTFNKPIDVSKSMISIAPIKYPSVDGTSYDDFQGFEYVIDFGDVSKASAWIGDFVTIRSKFNYDAYYMSSGHAYYANLFFDDVYNIITEGDANANGTYFSNSSVAMLRNYGVDGTATYSSSNDIQDGVVTAGEDSKAITDLGTALAEKFSAGAWAGLNGVTTYVQIRVKTACAFAITAIGDYDLTDVNSDAYKEEVEEELPEPESYDYFNVVDGSVSYAKTKIQTYNPNFNTDTLEGYHGATIKANTLVLDLNSAESEFTFGKPVDITSATAITIAPIWKEDITDIGGIEIEFFITLTDAENPDNYVVIRQKIIEYSYYALAGHAGLNGALVGKQGDNYVSTANGEQRYGTYVSLMNQNLLKSYTVSNGKAVASHIKDAGLIAFGEPTVIADLTDANYIGEAPAFEGFTSGKVYVSVSASKAHSFAITTIGEYDLTDVESGAYDEKPVPTVESAVDGLLSMKEGASIRYDEGTSGIRFETLINAGKKAELDYLVSSGAVDSYSFGTIIVPFDYLTGNDNPTHETLTEDKYYDLVSTYETGASFKGALVGIKAENYDREWIGRGYIKVVVDTVATYYYANYSADNARSVYEVALDEYKAKDTLGLVAEEIETLKGYIDGVVVLDAEYNVVDKGIDYDEPYTVSVEGGVVTITSTVAIKSVVVNGAYVVASISGNTATIAIA